MSAGTRELIRQFNVAFDRPVNTKWTSLTVSERELLGKLLLEETLEYVTKGLGLRVTFGGVLGLDHTMLDTVSCELNEGQQLDPIECVDGLADVNVVIHFCAHWHGFNLDKATEIVNESNMSKLGAHGKPIINGVTPGYATAEGVAAAHRLKYPSEEFAIGTVPDSGYDPNKPIGKILKGPNFVPPTFGIQALIMEGNNNE